MAEKPMVYGHVKDVVPLAIDTGGNIYQIHDEPIFSASEPRTMQIVVDDSFDTFCPDTLLLPTDMGEIPIAIIIYGKEQQEVTYDENMPGMTLDEFQEWSDQVIREAKEDFVE